MSQPHKPTSKVSVLQTQNIRILQVLLALTLCTALALWTANKVKADPVAGGIAGAVGGAIIGGALNGGKGAGRGALIGLGVGVAAGALAEEEKRKKRRVRRHKKKRHYVRHSPPPRYAEPAPYDPQLVYDTQLELRRLGYNPGPADGVYGPQTADALATYQDDYALPITGEPTPDLLYHMRKHDG